ncbi:MULTISPECIES: hypothetical protein [Modicisalibacter]|uniref:Uracil-DNA glycosylase-like domain-containing protein n=1 Tax=Modicisalibacter tunisiensis TaxID=390637 RepID=A0ABS7WYV9_9GAMM|nr:MULTISPECIES: hypothetical protein [Modicisalibacter]MBZ9539207.1 hypothetical protein [Modicisalibacter tunisiensis]MBZ9567398.1 hypothetical protein [Modicisalibacter tunisiensis]
MVAEPLGEPQRSQYLEAMGLTAWVGRYRLPNARESQACDWPEPSHEPARPPAQRLHALLDEAAPEPRPMAASEEAPVLPRANARRARALLGGAAEPPEPETPQAVPAAAEAETVSTPEPREALRFALQVAALEGRWLILLPGETPPDAKALRLLGNLLRAAGIEVEMPAFQAFRWPLMDGLSAEAPLQEAQDGLQAFIDGRRRRGWQPERVLLFGDAPVLSRVLAADADRCGLLELPLWQGETLATLATSAEAKRALWPYLAEWRTAWRSLEGGVS